MPVDFRDAADRHWTDSWYLSNNNRLPNADHLLGLAAECALKAIMLGLGMLLRTDGAPDEKGHRVHINELWDEFITFAQKRNGTHYAAMLSGNPNPFSDWNINQRYNHRTQFNEPLVTNHRTATKAVMKVLQEFILREEQHEPADADSV